VIPFSREPQEDIASDPASPSRTASAHQPQSHPQAWPRRELRDFLAGPGEASPRRCIIWPVDGLGGERVLLIDSDLRRPTQHHLARRPRSPGLSDLLLGKEEWDAVIQKEIYQGLDFIPSGGQPGLRSA